MREASFSFIILTTQLMSLYRRDFGGGQLRLNSSNRSKATSTSSPMASLYCYKDRKKNREFHKAPRLPLVVPCPVMAGILLSGPIPYAGVDKKDEKTVPTCYNVSQ